MHMHRGNRPAVRVRVRTYVYACTRREGNGERVASVCPASVEQGRIEGRIGSLEEGKREREGRSGVRAGQLPVRFSRALWKGESSEERRTRGRTGARRRRRWRRTITERRNRRE